MASLRHTPAGSFIVCFRYQGQQFQRALKTKDPGAAKAAMGRVEDALYKLSTGDLAVPPGVSPGDFIVWGEAAVAKARKEPEAAEPKEPVPTLGGLIEAYLHSNQGLKADTSLGTERSHLKTLKKCLAAKVNLPADRITRSDLDGVLRQRRKEVEPVTVKKERQTIMLLFAWAVRNSHLPASPAEDLETIRAGRNRDSFRTLEEVEEIVARGELADDEALKSWESLFLTQEEIGEILSLVKERARYDFIYPMFSIAAYTGMRRGEIVQRLRWPDVNFNRSFIVARSKKQSRQNEETSREITLHPELADILRAYRARRPKGQHVICSADTLLPLTVYQAHDHFRRTLQGTRWERELPSGKKKVIIGFHTFRHSFASNMAMRGVDQRIINRWMGHQTQAMVQRYQHLFPSKLAEAIQAVSYNGSGEPRPGGQTG